MPASILSVTKTYKDGQDLFERDLDNIRNPIESWAQDAVDNMTQLALDCFGTSYDLDNAGNANNAAPIYNVSNSTSSLNWIFSGTHTLRTTSDTTLIIDANALNFDARIAFQETGITRWLQYNDGSDSDILKIMNGSSIDTIQLTQAGALRINVAVNTDPTLGFYEAGSQKWNIFNDNTNDNITFQDSTNSTKFRVSGGAAVDTACVINAPTGLNPAIHLMENLSTKWRIFNDSAGTGLTISDSVSATKLLITAGAALDTTVRINAPTNQSPNLAFLENGSSRWLVGSSSIGSDELIFFDQTNTQRITLFQNGNLTLKGTGTTTLAINAATNTDPHLLLQENGSQKWLIANDNTNDTINFQNASAVNISILTQTGALLLADINTPLDGAGVANISYANRNSMVKAWGEVLDAGVAAFTDSYNMDSVTDGAPAGIYDVTISTDLSAANYSIVATIKSAAAADRILSIETTSATMARVTITTTLLAGVDDSFTFIVIGR